MARTAPRLDDEIGHRPVEATVSGEDVGSTDGAVRVVWLGDSTSTGVGSPRLTGSMAHRVATMRHDAALLTILGVSGAQVHEVVDDQLPDLLERVADGDVPDVVYVSIGANDVTALTRRPTFRDQYGTMIDGIESAVPDAEVVLVGIPDMGTAPRLPVPLRQIAGVRAAQLDDVIGDLADGAGLHHVDLAGRTSRTFSSDPGRYFSLDDFHPSPEGHRVWAEAVVDSLEQGG